MQDLDIQSQRIKVMAAEVIEAALVDLRGRAGLGCRHRAVRQLLEWFNKREQTPFGYGWCLSVSGFNPMVVRRIINKLLAHPRYYDPKAIRRRAKQMAALRRAAVAKKKLKQQLKKEGICQK